jgi:ActR/RegA family two-component response regulator
MPKVLLIDADAAHGERVGIMLAQRGLAVTRVAEISEAIDRLKARARAWEIVVLVVGDLSRPWTTLLHNLQEAAWQSAMPEVPLFLCVAMQDFGTDFQLRIERMGARYACEE